MFKIQEHTLNVLLTSLKNGEQTGPEEQRNLENVAVLSQNNPTAPVPNILNWFHFSYERARRTGRPSHNILRITAIILSTIFSKSRVSYGEDCDDDTMNAIDLIFQFYSNYLNQAIEHASLRHTGKGLTSSIAHLCLELFIEKLRQFLDSPSLKPNLHEVLISSLSEIKFKIHPEGRLELAIRLLNTLGKRLGHINSTTIKEVYCTTISSLLLPIIPDISAEANIPEWTHLIEDNIWPKADALFAKSRFSQISASLMTSLLCVSRTKFFLEHQASFITSLVHRVKDKDVKADNLISVLQLWWIYCFRHAESLSTLSQQAERLYEKLFFSSRNKFPEITPMMQCYFLWISLAKLTRHAILKQIIPILTSAADSLTAVMPRTTGSSLGSIGSALMSSLSFNNLLPESIATERSIQAITAYMAFLNNRKPEFPTSFVPLNIELLTTFSEEPEHKSLCVSVTRLLLVLDKHIRHESDNKQIELFMLILKCMPVLLHQDAIPIIVKWITNNNRILANEAMDALRRCIALHNEQFSALIHAQLLLLLTRTPCTFYTSLEPVLTAMRALLRHQSFSPIDTISVLATHVISFNTITSHLAVECLELVRSFIPSDSPDRALTQLYTEIPNVSPTIQSFLNAPTIAAMIKPSVFRFMRELALKFEKAKEGTENDDSRDINTTNINQWQRYAAFFCCNGALTIDSGPQSTFNALMEVTNLVFKPYITHHSGRIRGAAIDALLDLNPTFVEPFLREVWSPLTRSVCTDFINPRFKFLRKNGITVMRKGDLLKVDLTHTLHNLILAHLPISVGLIIKYIVELWYFCIEIDRDNQLPQLRYWACKTLAVFVDRIRLCWEDGLLPARLHIDVWMTIYGWSKGVTNSEGINLSKNTIKSASADSLAKSTLMTQSSLSFASIHQEQTQALNDSLLSLSYRLPVKDFVQLFEWLDTLTDSLTEAICNLFYNKSIQGTLLQMILERAYEHTNSLKYAMALFEAVYRDILIVDFGILIVLALHHNDAHLTSMLTQKHFTSTIHLSMILADEESLQTSERVVLEGCERLNHIGVLFPWISNLVIVEDLITLLHALFKRSETMCSEICRIWQQWCLWRHHLPEIIHFLLNETDRTDFIEAMALVEPQLIASRLIPLTQYKYLKVADKALKWFDLLIYIHKLNFTDEEFDAIEHAKYVIQDNDFPRNSRIALDWALECSNQLIRNKSWLAYQHIHDYRLDDLIRIIDRFEELEDDQMILTISQMIDAKLFDSRLLELRQYPLIVATLIKNDFVDPIIHLEHPDVIFALLEKSHNVKANITPYLLITLPELLKSPFKCKIFAQWIKENYKVVNIDDFLGDPIIELSSLIPRLSQLQNLPATLSGVLLEIGNPETILSHLHHNNQTFQAKFLQHFLPCLKRPFSTELILQVSELGEALLPFSNDFEETLTCITKFLSQQ